MRDRINNAVEKADDMGRRIYLAEVAGWKELVSLVGMPSSIATVIDGVSIIAGLVLFALTSGTVSMFGVLLTLVGVGGVLRRVLS